MTSLADALLGRDDELARLEGLLDAAASGSAGFALVTGEPGIGKSSLLGELADRGNEAGFLVLEGRAAEFERLLPLALVIDAFDEYLASLDPAATRRVAGEGLAELAVVFPALRGLGEEDQERSERRPAERFRAYHAIRSLIEGLGARQPLLLLLDDLHWADSASLELAAHLLRRPPGAAVLLVAAMRSGQAPASVTAALEATQRAGELVEIELGPLSRSDAEPLLAETEPARRERLYEASGGNPFFLQQLARSPAEPPPAVSAAIQGELAAVAEEAQALAAGAAVAGDPFDIDLAAAIAGIPEAGAFSALDELVARDLVRTTEVPRRFRFRHPLVRSAIYEASSPGARLHAHARAASALEERGAPATQRAHHVEASASPGDRTAVDVLGEAGRVALKHAPAVAARWFEAALRLLPEGAGQAEPQRLGLEVQLAGALAAAGRPHEAIPAMKRALAHMPDDPAAPKIELAVGCSTLEHMVGQRESAKWTVDMALGLARPGSVDEVRVLAHMPIIARYSGDFDEMHRAADVAVTSAEQAGSAVMLAKTKGLRAYSHAHRGRVDAARGDRAAAREHLAGVPDADIGADLDAFVTLASASYFLEDYPAANSEIQRGIDAARALGQRQWDPVMLLVQAASELGLGNLETSARMHDEVIDAARVAGDAQGLIWGLSWRGRTAALAGDLQLALSAAEECQELLSEVQTVGLFTWFAGNRAATLLAAGRPERAREAILETGGGDALPEVPPIDRCRQLALVTEAALALDEREEATRRAARARELAGELGLPVSGAHAARAQAALLDSREEHGAAAEIALEAAGPAEDAGASIEAAQLRLLAGRSLAAQDEREPAVRELERAEAALAASGAELLRQRATAELRRLGRGRHARRGRARPDATGLDGLSEREREIAQLVRERRTNPQIAEELFLSVKTVESHVRNIFRKLDVSSRVELAQIVEREERSSG